MSVLVGAGYPSPPELFHRYTSRQLRLFYDKAVKRHNESMIDQAKLLATVLTGGKFKA